MAMNTIVINTIKDFKDDENHPIFMDVWINVNGGRMALPSPYFITKVAPYDIKINPV